MLKVEIDETKAKAEAKGGIDTITCEIAVLIHCMYNQIHENDAISAQVFRKMLTKLVADPNSVIWTDLHIGGTGICMIIPKRRGEDAK